VPAWGFFYPERGTEMVNLKMGAAPVSVVLVSLILWVSFAWGLPADTPAAEGKADEAPQGPWAGVRISDAYDYAKCAQCGKKNEVRAESCSRCRRELPQPSAEVTDPASVFVPGKGYYREGTLLEPGKKGLLIPGLVLAGSGLAAFTVGCTLAGESETGEMGPEAILVFAGFGMAVTGGVLLIIALATWTEPVYAFGCGERFGPYESEAFARRSPDTESVGLKVEVTLLSF
jgi:hypothetical protein